MTGVVYRNAETGADAQLTALDMPILAIVGGRDVLLDSADTRARLQRNVPHAEIFFSRRRLALPPRPDRTRHGVSGAER